MAGGYGLPSRYARFSADTTAERGKIALAGVGDSGVSLGLPPENRFAKVRV